MSLAQPEMSVLTETEIARLANAYDELIAEASEPERHWWSLGKAIVLTALGTALRRGELIGLRWRSVNLLESEDRRRPGPLPRRGCEERGADVRRAP